MMAAIPLRSAWRNPLPAWVTADAGYLRLRGSVRETLQTIADRCDRTPMPCGSLKACVGGAKLAATAGVSLATLWRHLRKLERLGYVVCLGHLHPTGVNVYGVPGSPGALDGAHAPRKTAQMVRCEDGIYRQQIIEPGGQMTFLHLAELHAVMQSAGSNPQCPPPAVTARHDRSQREPQADSGTVPDAKRSGIRRGEPFLRTGDDTPPVSKRHGTRVNLTRVTTLTIGNTSARTNGWNGASARRTGEGMPRMEPRDLADAWGVQELYAIALGRGLADPSEEGRLRFAAYAAHARRVATDPVRMLAALLNRGHCRRGYTGHLFISQADEEAGRKLVAEART